MDREKIQTFIQTAETELASVRSGLLLIAQHGDAAELASPRRNLACLRAAAAELGLSVIESLTADCDSALDLLSKSAVLAPNEVFRVLDLALDGVYRLSQKIFFKGMKIFLVI